MNIYSSLHAKLDEKRLMNLAIMSYRTEFVIVLSC